MISQFIRLMSKQSGALYVVGGILTAVGLLGLVIEKITQDDGAVLISGAILLGAASLLSSRRA